MLMTIVICRNLTKLYDDVIDESNIIDKRSKDNKDTSENVLIDIIDLSIDKTEKFDDIEANSIDLKFSLYNKCISF